VVFIAVAVAYLLQASPSDFKSQFLLEQKVKLVTSYIPYWQPGVDGVRKMNTTNKQTNNIHIHNSPSHFL